VQFFYIDDFIISRRVQPQKRKQILANPNNPLHFVTELHFKRCGTKTTDFSDYKTLPNGFITHPLHKRHFLK
jgi:hypothetical protein